MVADTFRMFPKVKVSPLKIFVYAVLSEKTDFH